MPSADDIRAGLSRAREGRKAADEARAKATAELRDWLRRVPEAEGLTMSEAAELGGVSRFTAYELLKDD